MNREDFFYLGKIVKPFGSKGHLAVFLDVDDPNRYKKLESVFVGIGHDRVPFFVDSFEIQPDNRVVIKFEDVNSLDDASIFRGRELFLPVSLLPPLRGKKFYYHEIVDFTVIDRDYGPIGTVQSVIELPTQSLLQIRNGDKEILVPVTDETINRLDRRKKEIHIIAPEGLIDIYL
jgi:16S rRNA processing protein RimM